MSGSSGRWRTVNQHSLKEEYMLRKLTERLHNEEKGFTLIELLVVMLIIGILAAIALPVFLNQQEKGQDADAKSNARNLVSHVESCYAETQTYESCDDSAGLGTTGLNLGAPDAQPAAGAVGVTESSADAFVVQGTSSSGNYFAIEKASDGTITRTCSNAFVAGASYNSGGGDGGCPDDETW